MWLTVALPAPLPVTVTVCGVFQPSPVEANARAAGLTAALVGAELVGRIVRLADGRLFSRTV